MICISGIYWVNLKLCINILWQLESNKRGLKIYVDDKEIMEIERYELWEDSHLVCFVVLYGFVSFIFNLFVIWNKNLEQIKQNWSINFEVMSIKFRSREKIQNILNFECKLILIN